MIRLFILFALFSITADGYKLHGIFESKQDCNDNKKENQFCSVYKNY